MIRENTPGGGADRAREEGFGSDRMTQHAREAAHDVAEQAKRKASEAAQKIKSSGKQVVNGQKGRASKVFSDLGSALHDAAEELEQKGDRMLASYTHTIAEQADKASDYLEEHDIRDLFNRVQNVVRQRPEIFLGVMFIVGLGVARFLKSSHRSSIEDRSSEGESQYSGGSQHRYFGERQDLGVGESISGGPADVYPEPGGPAVESIGGPVSEFNDDVPAPHFVQEQSDVEQRQSPNPSRTPDRPDYEEEI